MAEPKLTFAELCIKHSMKSTMVGVILMIVGVTGGVLLELFYHHIPGSLHPIIIMAYHALIIFGEAIAVLFFLHHVVEKNTHQNYLGIFNKNAGDIEANFSNLISNFDSESRQKIIDIQDNFFKAILKGLDYMPYEIVEYIHKAKYATHFIRRKLRIKYKFSGMSGNTVIIKQEMMFEIENVTNSTKEEYYEMPLKLTPILFIDYELLEASYQYVKSQRFETFKRNKFTKKDVNESFDNANNQYSLKKVLGLIGDERIDVYQFLNASYTMDSNETISDYYHSMYYTVDIEITIDMPPYLDFKIVPTSPSKNIVSDTLGDTQHIKISFLLPGQGFYYAITKKKDFVSH